MKKLTDLHLKGKSVLIRVDFNVPIENERVIDNFRIKAALPTIQHCINSGASVILMSHLGRPKKGPDVNLSLSPVFFELEELLDVEVFFSEDCISKHAIAFSQELIPGEVHLLENLRFHSGEVSNDERFSELLSQHSNIFINDAFGTTHRSHSSNVGILNFVDKAVPGLLVEKELQNLNRALKKPIKPYTMILGGSKVEGKIGLIKNLLKDVDEILVGGKMAFSFIAAIGKNVGDVKIEGSAIKMASQLLEEADKNKVKITLPKDFVTIDNGSGDWGITLLENITINDCGMDIGPETCMVFEDIIAKAKTILWNGPMGVFENPLFSTGTNAIASAIIQQTKLGAVSIIGGGDTASAVKSIELKHTFTHISTGGGASLELLSGIKLPAIEALRNI